MARKSARRFTGVRGRASADPGKQWHELYRVHPSLHVTSVGAFDHDEMLAALVHHRENHSTTDGQLLEQLSASIPKDSQVAVLIYNAEIAPGGHTNWHCHNGATFFVAVQGIFEARFEDGSVLTAKAGDVYSEPIGKFHRGHNPHPDLPYLCIAFCLTSPDRPHVTNREG